MCVRTFPIFLSCFLLVSSSLSMNRGGGASIHGLYTSIRIADIAGNPRGAEQGMGQNTVHVGESYGLQKDSRQRRWVVKFSVFKPPAQP